ncbi:MAG: alpha-L-fucosidase [Duncaniella sp.]|nr:alpha-L-fucosidase [Duncaniella sp.]
MNKANHSKISSGLTMSNIMRRVWVNYTLITATCFVSLAQTNIAPSLPELPPYPEVHSPLLVESVKLGDIDNFEEVQLGLPITPGPFEATWESIEKNYPGSPQWLRDAKIGFWVHFGPQASGESGDWYARNLYKPGHIAYENHLKNFGHPSEVGYKEVLRDWKPSKLDPEALASLYKKAGARFLLIQGVHHDNYDLWDSQYQPWNSVNIGPKRDILKEWVEACHKNELRFGVTFHHEYTWWWWQTAFAADSSGDKAGIPYDGTLTLGDGKDKWWEGYDPRLLYGIDLREYETVESKTHTPTGQPGPGIYTGHLEYCKWYATQWALRIMDVTANYKPDFIYTDGNTQGPFTGRKTGVGYKCNAMQTVMADYFNRQLRDKGVVDGFAIIKFRKGTNGAMNTAEHNFPDTINRSQPWIREAPIGDWFYAPGFVYDSGTVIRFIIEAIARDGNVALNIPMLPDGSIEDKCVSMLEEVGRWLDINGEAIYGSHAWHTLGEGEMVNGKLKKLPGGRLGQIHADFKFDSTDIRFSVGKDGSLYAFCMNLPEKGEKIRIKSLAKGNGLDVKSLKLLGVDEDPEWEQTSESLTIEGLTSIPCQTSIVFKIN